MASGQVNRIKRPNTWLRRPMLQNREESSCQNGALHTWHLETCPLDAENIRSLAGVDRKLSAHSRNDAFDPTRTSADIGTLEKLPFSSPERPAINLASAKAISRFRIGSRNREDYRWFN
jgi:hypothetical protein